MSKKDKLGPAYTHEQIMKDPLVTIAVDKGCWLKRGLRKIVLKLVEKFMKVNGERVLGMAKLKGGDLVSAKRFLEARDVVTIKSIVSASVEWGGGEA